MSSGDDNLVLDVKEDILASLRETVADYGWTSFSVPSVSRWWRKSKPSWAYSIGLYQTYGLPEVVVIGRDPDLMARMLSDLHEKIKAGLRYGDGDRAEDMPIGNISVLRLIDKKHYQEYLPWALSFYGNSDFPVVQSVWTDSNNILPWQPGHDTSLRKFQPLLFKA